MSKHYGACTYCHRQLTRCTDRGRTAATKDHVMPKCVGGTRKVPCCRQCNELKGDMHPSVWRWFQTSYPAWWKSFRSHHEVVAACRPHWGAMISVQSTGRAMRYDIDRRLGHLPPAAE